jgi:hypothetical protein
MADRAASITPYMSMHQGFCFLFRKLFCRDVSAVLANGDVTPIDQERSIWLL